MTEHYQVSTTTMNYDKDRPAAERAIYEWPLHEWRDVAGSKVKARDFFISFFELIRIYWTYLRPGLATTPLAGGVGPAAAERPEGPGRGNRAA